MLWGAIQAIQEIAEYIIVIFVHYEDFNQFIVLFIQETQNPKKRFWRKQKYFITMLLSIECSPF